MEFKPIKGYEGIYEACSDGTIWSCEGKQLTVIGTEELESVYGSAENSNYKHKSDKEVAREIKRLNCGKTAK